MEPGISGFNEVYCFYFKREKNHSQHNLKFLYFNHFIFKRSEFSNLQTHEYIYYGQSTKPEVRESRFTYNRQGKNKSLQPLLTDLPY
jgi:hypothetical protein